MADKSITQQEEEPIHLEEELPEEAPHAEVKAFGAGHNVPHKTDSQYKRKLNLTGQGATRCKVYFSKIAPPSLEFMENQINHWLDSEQIEVKQVSQVIGVMEGKTPQPNLIVLVWY